VNAAALYTTSNKVSTITSEAKNRSQKPVAGSRKRTDSMLFITNFDRQPPPAFLLISGSRLLTPDPLFFCGGFAGDA
jgi:hypothetical protein